MTVLPVTAHSIAPRRGIARGRIATRVLGAALVGLSLTVAACAPTPGPRTVSRDEIGAPSRVAFGEVLAVEQVVIDGKQSGAGALGGAVAGGAAGAALGGDAAGSIIGGVAGAALGGLAGNAIERGVTRQEAFEYVVRDSTGATFTIVQGGALISPGTPVRIIYGTRVRIVPDTGGAFYDDRRDLGDDRGYGDRRYP